MAGAAPATLLPSKGATVDILGHKISWDALLIAGAGLAGVIFLYKVGQPQSSGSGSPMSTVDPSGGGADAASISTVPAALPGPVDYSSGLWIPSGGIPGAGSSGPSVGPLVGPSPGPGSQPTSGAGYYSNVGSPTQATYTPPSSGAQNPNLTVTAGSPSSSAPAPAPSIGGAVGAALAAVPTGPAAAPATVLGGGGGSAALAP